MGKGKGRKQPMGRAESRPASAKDEIYEAEDVELPEERNANRYDRVDNYEYELPSDFEDEEIDEDMAFTEEDKLLYGHMFDDLGGGRRGGSEGEEEEEEDSEGEGLLESDEEGEEGEEGYEDEEDELAMFGEDEDGFGEEGGSSEGEGGEGESGSEGDEEDAEHAEARHAAMLAAVRGSGGAGAEGKQRKGGRRHREVVVNEAYPESEYNLAGAGGAELTLTDLISGLGDAKSKLGGARKALERLEKKAQPVSAPLPGPIRQRQERKAGYEETKKEVTKWMPLVKANREAPTLRFTADRDAVPRTSTTAALAAKHVPETDMEAEVAALLERAGAHSAKAVAEAEEALALKALSVEEARERQNRLAKMRALLFYHEVKAKRMKKIKSKEYHRKLKKAEKRKAGAPGEAGDEEELLRLQEEAEFERAKERLTLKHRNTSRWARRALKRGTELADEGTKAAIAEQLRLGQELRQRVDRMRPGGKGSDSDGSTSASDGEYDYGDDYKGTAGAAGLGAFSGKSAGRALTSKAKAAAAELLAGGGGGEGKEGGEGGSGGPSKGLFALPFMRRALEKKRQQAQEEARQILKELEEEEGGATAAAAAEAGAGFGAGAGRMSFGGGADTPASAAAQREAQRRRQRAAAAALNSDSEFDADSEEDAEAKAQRLGRRLAGEDTAAADLAAAGGTEGDEAVARGDFGGAGEGPSLANGRAANGWGAGGAGRAMAAGSDGPISIEMPAGRRRRRGAAAAAGQQQQQQQRWGQHAGAGGEGEGAAQLPTQHLQLLSAGKGGGKQGRQQQQQQQGGAGVSIGPASAAASRPAAAAAAAAAGGGAEEGPGPAFVASKAFKGARPGYVFKKGPRGVGYYADEKEGQRAAAKQQTQQGKAQQAQQAQQQAGKGSSKGRGQGSCSDGEGGDEEAAKNMRPVTGGGGGAKGSRGGQGGLSQEELVRLAFAGDDVAAQFAADKAEEVEGELPKVEEPGVLPGWGTWAGQQREPKWMVEAREKAKKQRASATASRSDAKLQYVIISEKWDKKSAKYKAPSLPFPFDSKATYERAMRQPLGREYNTDASFRNLTRPAILKDAGVIIEPIRYSKAIAEADAKQPKASKRPAVTTIAGGMPKRPKVPKPAGGAAGSKK